jgi:hypothetical protein
MQNKFKNTNENHLNLKSNFSGTWEKKIWQDDKENSDKEWLVPLDIKRYYTVMVIKMVWLWNRIKEANPWQRWHFWNRPTHTGSSNRWWGELLFLFLFWECWQNTWWEEYTLQLIILQQIQLKKLSHKNARWKYPGLQTSGQKVSKVIIERADDVDSQMISSSLYKKKLKNKRKQSQKTNWEKYLQQIWQTATI